MKVYFAPKIMKALVIFIQHLNKEVNLMHLEDIQSFSLRTTEQISSAYKKARLDSIRQLSIDLSKIFGTAFPSDNYEKILEKLIQAYQSKENIHIIKNIECNLSDLYRLIKDTKKIIELAEQEISQEGKLRLRKFKINVKVQKDRNLEGSKIDIAKLFGAECNSELNDEVTQYVYAIKHELQEFKNKSCEDFSVVDPGFENFIESFEEFSSRGTTSMSMQEMLTVKYQRQQKKLIKEKEWEKHEIQILKQQLKNKKKKLKNRVIEQQDMEKLLKKKNLDIEKEKAELDRLKENYYREKKRIQAGYENKSKKLSEFLSELVTSFDNFETVGKISPITETEMFSDISFVSDSDTSFECYSVSEPDINMLQKRIFDLESQYKSEQSTETQEKIKKELDSLKNSYTNLRSAQALKVSNSNQKRFSFMRNISLTEVNSKKNTPLALGTPKPRSSLISQRQVFKSNTATPKANSQTFNFNEIFPKTEETELKKFLRAQEVRLKEKEEKLEKDRESWLEKWNKTPDANQLIPLVQKEILEYRKKCEELDKKVKEIEVIKFNLDSKESDLAKIEKDVEVKMKEVNENKRKLEEEKGNIVQRLEKLIEELNR